MSLPSVPGSLAQNASDAASGEGGAPPVSNAALAHQFRILQQLLDRSSAMQNNVFNIAGNDNHQGNLQLAPPPSVVKNINSRPQRSILRKLMFDDMKVAVPPRGRAYSTLRETVDPVVARCLVDPPQGLCVCPEADLREVVTSVIYIERRTRRLAGTDGKGARMRRRQLNVRKAMKAWFTTESCKIIGKKFKKDERAKIIEMLKYSKGIDVWLEAPDHSRISPSYIRKIPGYLTNGMLCFVFFCFCMFFCFCS